jgi:primosomal protein N' (replication factor Y)
MAIEQFVDVIVPLALKGPFTYSVPERMSGTVCQGGRVLVQFGKRKVYAGIVRKIHTEKPKDFETKPVKEVLDQLPVVTAFQLNLWEWITEYYMCTVGEVMKAALPAGLRLESSSSFVLNEEVLAQHKLNDHQELIIQILRSQKKMNYDEFRKIVKDQNFSLGTLNKMLDNGTLSLEERIVNKYKPKRHTIIKLKKSVQQKQVLNELLDELSKAPKQKEILMTFLSHSGVFEKGNFDQSMHQSVLLKKSNANSNTLKALISKNIFEAAEVIIDRIDLPKETKDELPRFMELSEAQAEALKSVNEFFERKRVVLLHGVTSSGKTEIYIRLMDEMIKSGRQVLYLLPEIAITAQIIERLKSLFGNIVGIYHSKYGNAERTEVYNNLLNKNQQSEYKIILGVRSSLFLPFRDLGLIIVDEEHEHTYKQTEPAPRYHARDTAIVMAGMHDAKVILGTATPSIESFFNAKTGKYGYVEIKERYAQIEMPEIQIIDLKDVRKKRKMKSHFSFEMIHEIERALAKKEQIILFQNRRGYAPFIECQSCGWVPKCHQCDVSLTYHRYQGSLICHHCGYTREILSKCPACGNLELKAKGFGTEKIEEEIQTLFPDAKTTRLDMDTVRRKNSYVNILKDFEQGRYDILIGTQMISKGLNFERVRLVGILNADNLLNFPDFRAHEKCFQMLSQVSGRAGRKYKRGLVLIQSSAPSTSVLRDVLQYDYLSMFNREIAERKQFRYPPFYRLIRLILKHRDQSRLNAFSEELATALFQNFPMKVMGPSDPVIPRVQNFYSKHILIRLERGPLIEKSKKTINNIVEKQIKLSKYSSGVQVHFDVDSYS